MADSLKKNLVTESPEIFSVEQICAFTSKTQLGFGGFGVVYEGILPNGKRVAVKVLNGKALSDDTKDQLKAEVGVLCRTHHENIVKLYGFCFEQEMAALVYEFVENKSLDKILYKKERIEWETICKIAIGTAAGLSYLHNYCQPSIIHYDIKPSNILLDSKFTPKVGDFGLAMHLNRDKSHITMLGTRGTCIYMAPEMNAQLSTITHKFDVYSYGITLFDLIGRRKHPKVCDENWFPAKVWTRFEKKQQDVIMDECGIQEKDHREQAKRILMIALCCVQFDPEKRPSMSCVLRLLEGSEEVRMPPNPFLDLASSSCTKIEDSASKVDSEIIQEKKELRNNNAHLFMKIRVARDEDLVEQSGRNILMDLHEDVWIIRLEKSTPFYTFKEIVEKKFGVPVQFQRFWLWRRNSDKSYRPTRPLMLKEEKQSVGQVREIYNSAELKLFLEVQRGPDLLPIKFPTISNRDLMIFVKRYDQKRKELRYVGRLFVDEKSKPSEVLAKLKRMAGFSSSETTILSMEISIHKLLYYTQVKMHMTFEDNKIIDGDIICIDKPYPVREKELYATGLPREQQYRYPITPYRYRDDPHLNVPYHYDLPHGNPYGPSRYPDEHHRYPDAPYSYPDDPGYLRHNLPRGNPYGPCSDPGEPYRYPNAPHNYPEDPGYLRHSPMNSSYRAEDGELPHRRKSLDSLADENAHVVTNGLPRWMGKVVKWALDG